MLFLKSFSIDFPIAKILKSAKYYLGNQPLKVTCMENVYSSYTRRIESVTYYFVKKFVVFADLKDMPPILEGYGMHTNFDQACAIAGIEDTEIKSQLLTEIETGLKQAKVIDLNDTGYSNQKVAGL